MPHLAVRNAAADRQAKAWQPSKPLRTQAVQLLPSRSRFQTWWFLHLQLGCRQETVQQPFFSHPAGGGFCDSLDRRHPHCLHRHCIRSNSRCLPGGCTSDLFSSKPMSELRRSPVEASDRCHPAVHSDRHLIPILCCTVPVYKRSCIWNNKSVLSRPLSLLHVHKLQIFAQR